MRVICGAILAVAGAAFAQTAPARVEFEVASIKPAAPLPGDGVTGLHIDGAQVRATFLALTDYIRWAYKLKHYQISGPEWLGTERFDLTAKLPAGASKEQVGEMVQALLADRFRMKTHRDTKEFPVLGMVVAKGGLKMTESPLDPEPEGREGAKGAVNVTASGTPGGTSVNLGRGASFSVGNNRIEGKKMTMAQFAELLARFTDRPVVDMTELKGSYDFALEFSPEDFRAMMIRAAIAAGRALPPEAMKLLELGNGDSLANAMQALGLKLEQRKAPIEVLVVDHILKMPTEN